MSVEKYPTGLSVEGRKVFLVRLHSDTIDVEVSTLGGGLRGIYLPFEGKKRNILFRYLSEDFYLKNDTYAGAVLCPNAGRIASGILKLDGTTYHLSKNENGTTNLHGGYECASFRNWALKSMESTDNGAMVVLETKLPDGTDGYPGNRVVEIEYILQNNTLRTNVSAISDQRTYLNLSMHPYFNLSGDFSISALENFLQISADRVVSNDATHIPNKIISVENTPFDLRKGRILREVIEQTKNEEIQRVGGYNNAFVINTESQESLIMKSEYSGYSMTVKTNAPTILAYTGSHICGVPLENGITGMPCCAIALECQDYPNATNLLPDGCKITSAGERVVRTIEYSFSWR